jgi:hypothetical protein
LSVASNEKLNEIFSVRYEILTLKILTLKILILKILTLKILPLEISH